MKIFLFLLLLSGISACNSFEFQREKDDGSISGTVSFLWSQVGLSSAHAQTPQDALNELTTYSLGTDLFIISSAASYNDSVDGALADAQYYATEIGGLISTNVMGFSTSADFPHGAVLAMGFNSSKSLVSFNLAKVSAAGTYSLNDGSFQRVSFYKLAFILNDGGSPKYRQTFIFRDGTKMTAAVTETSTIRSAKLSEELGVDSSVSVSQMKSTYRNSASVVRSAPSQDVVDMIGLYTNQHYGDYASLNPVQKFLMDASIYYRMSEDSSMLNVMESRRADFANFILVGRPNTLSAYCTGDPELEDLLLNKVDSSVTNLSNQDIIPRVVDLGGR